MFSLDESMGHYKIWKKGGCFCIVSFFQIFFLSLSMGFCIFFLLSSCSRIIELSVEVILLYGLERAESLENVPTITVFGNL